MLQGVPLSVRADGREHFVFVEVSDARLPNHLNANLKDTRMPFDYNLDFDNIDFREHPELYRIGRGEQGVLSVQPYKGEILPHWRFKTMAEAEASAKKIYALFGEYKAQEDFVGMDMARKFLQMGYTRARRYANHPSGRKYQERTEGNEVLPQTVDWATNEKAQAAQIFYGFYEKAKDDPDYARLKLRHTEQYGK